MRKALLPVVLVASASLTSACSGVRTEPAGAMEVLAPEPQPAEQAPAEPELDTPARDRWESPFAVSGTGRAIIREPRSVVVLGADSAIAEALAAARQEPRSSSETERRTPAGAGQASDPVLLLGVPSDGDRGTPSRAEADARRTSTRSSVPSNEVDGDAGAETLLLHQVEPGDTWSRIVIRYRVTSQALTEANPDVDPDRIRSGQVLRIPRTAAVSTSRSHRVGRGETLRGIATRYNVTADEIRRLNGMDDERVTMGQTLLIPAVRESGRGDGR
jgi:LysM repeat protein